MQVHITWEAVSAICAVLTGLAAALAFVIRAIVRSEMDRLDGRFVFAQVFEAHADELDRRLKLLENRHAA